MDIVCFQGAGHFVELRDSVPKHFIRESLIVVRGGDDGVNRLAVSSKTVDILLDPHLGYRHDRMHHRDSGLNQVLCILARQHHVAVGFSFASVLTAPDRWKSIGRLMQNIELCQKYKVPMVIGSFARDVSQQRSEQDMQAFFRVLGMTGVDVRTDFVEKRLDWKRRYVREHVMLAR